MKPLYEGHTARGRIVRDDSHFACLDALAFVMNKETASLVTVQAASDRWYVYDSQEALDADPKHEKWIACIEDRTAP